MRRLLIAVTSLLMLSSCVASQNDGEGATQTATSVRVAESSASEAVSVVVRLPRSGHSEPIDGWVVDSDGEQVVQFRFEAAVLYERVGEGYSGSDYDRTDTGAPLQLALELPTAGVYTFHLGAVAYFGGCGTCGAFHGDGGSIQIAVADGAVVELDVGEATMWS